MSDGQPNLPGREIEELRTELRFIQQRLTAINHRLDHLARKPAAVAPPPAVPLPAAVPPPLPPVVEEPAAQPPLPPPVSAPPPILPVTTRAEPATAEILRSTQNGLPGGNAELPPVVPPVQPTMAPRESFEVRLGTYWLPRIGMLSLLVGIVFFVGYWVPRMTVGQKVALAYLGCAALGGLGWWLEKRMEQLARVLQAGALALTYLCTFAAHEVEAFRVIESQAVALVLLSLIVTGIVVLADRRQSATLASLALFFGYFTTVMSKVTMFTLAANAVLAGAALLFLWRNRWLMIAYGAVLATYLVYVIWVWQLNRFGDLERLIWASNYLSDADFRLRAGFLSLYWVLFTVGGLLGRREACPLNERAGLVTLNNVLFFVLFSLLVHHAHPTGQWAFQFAFGAALLVAAALAYKRFAPDRSLLTAFFLPALAVITLGLINKLKGVHLIGSLAVESLFLLWLARAMQMPWIAWIARAVFGVAALYAWKKWPHWDGAMTAGVFVTAAVGFLCVWQTKRVQPEADADGAGRLTFSAFYYATLSVVLAMMGLADRYARAELPVIWPLLAILVALIGVALRTRETVWLANLPLLWAHAGFYLGEAHLKPLWTTSQALWLVAVTLGFGLAVWGALRARENPRAGEGLLPYGLAAVIALVAVTMSHFPANVRLTMLAAEALVLLLAGFRLREIVVQGLAVLPLVIAHMAFHSSRFSGAIPLAEPLAVIAVTLAFGLLLWGRPRAAGQNGDRFLWVFGGGAVLAALATTFQYVPPEWRLAAFAAEGALLVVSGLPVFAWLALAPFGLGTLAFMGEPRFRLGPLKLAWNNVGIAWLLMLLSARLLRLREARRALRVTVVTLLTIVAFFALSKLLPDHLLTAGGAATGFLLLAIGFAVRERPYRIAGLVMLGFSLLRVSTHDIWRLETIYRILSFMALGAVLLVLAFLYTKNREKIAKWL